MQVIKVNKSNPMIAKIYHPNLEPDDRDNNLMKQIKSKSSRYSFAKIIRMYKLDANDPTNNKYIVRPIEEEVDGSEISKFIELDQVMSSNNYNGIAVIYNRIHDIELAKRVARLHEEVVERDKLGYKFIETKENTQISVTQ